MNADTALTYEQIKNFVVTAIPYAFDLSGLREDEHPLARIEKLEAVSEAKALRSMKTAVSDLLTIFSREPAEKLERLSHSLIVAGAPSLALIRAWSSRKIGAILIKGSIESDTEFEQLSAFLDLQGLKDEERRQIQRMVDAYEFGPSS
jgi:hypothetical protein